MRFRSTILFASFAILGGCAIEDSSQPSVPANETFAASLGIDLSTFTKISDDLYYKDIVVGTGLTAAFNKTISAFYTGWLKDGTQFDSNVGDSQPIEFPLNYAAGGPITGWVLGIPGMKVGGKRRLVIGSSYAYGADGRGTIPAHATLIFDVDLTSVK